MITGEADPEVLANGRPMMASLATAPLALPSVRVFQTMYEMPQRAREALVPPGLHPTNPAALVLQIWDCPESPDGAFRLAQARIQTRSGMRARGFVTGALCTNPAAGRTLAERFGFPIAAAEARAEAPAEAAAEIAFEADDAHVAIRVTSGDACVLEIRAEGPTPLDAEDVQFSTTLNLAHTPRGLRLVQVEPGIAAHVATRFRPQLVAFAPTAFGEPRLEPTHPVSASLTAGDMQLPALRFVCRPDVLAFEGTEPAASA